MLLLKVNLHSLLLAPPKTCLCITWQKSEKEEDKTVAWLTKQSKDIHPKTLCLTMMLNCVGRWVGGWVHACVGACMCVYVCTCID